jgi:hypothetical protein
MLFEDLRPDTTRRFKKWLDVNEASGQGSTSSQVNTNLFIQSIYSGI